MHKLLLPAALTNLTQILHLYVHLHLRQMLSNAKILIVRQQQ